MCARVKSSKAEKTTEEKLNNHATIFSSFVIMPLHYSYGHTDTAFSHLHRSMVGVASLACEHFLTVLRARFFSLVYARTKFSRRGKLLLLKWLQ